MASFLQMALYKFHYYACNDAVFVVVASSEMKDAQKLDIADTKDEPASVEMKAADTKSDSDSKEGVTKMDTIPAPVAVTTSEPSAEH